MSGAREHESCDWGQTPNAIYHPIYHQQAMEVDRHWLV